MQRLVEQTWELSPLSVRNTFNGLLWIGGLAAYLAVSGSSIREPISGAASVHGILAGWRKKLQGGPIDAVPARAEPTPAAGVAE